MEKWKKVDLELFAWVAGLLLLAFLDPSKSHLSICPLKFLGFRYCPGCGLGRSIGYLLHGQLAASFRTHPLGLFALPMIIRRIVILTPFQYRLFTVKN